MPYERKCPRCEKSLMYSMERSRRDAEERESVCKSCSLIGRPKSTQMTPEQFIARSREIHGDAYDYSLIKYRCVDEKIQIICPTHGLFEQTGTNHLHNRHGCRRCRSDNLRKGIERFIFEARVIHGAKYDYSSITYKSAHVKVPIGCPKHGTFLQSAHSHLSGHGCSACCHKNEQEVFELLQQMFPGWKITRRKLLWHWYLGSNKKRFCDFYLEKCEQKIVVEYDGEQHFKPVRLGGMPLPLAILKFAEQQKIDTLDAVFCNANVILLWRIRFDEDKKSSLQMLLRRVEIDFGAAVVEMEI